MFVESSMSSYMNSCWLYAGTETLGPLHGVASPCRPYVNKGLVYMRWPTPRKSEVVRDHGDTDTMVICISFDDISWLTWNPVHKIFC